VPVRRSIRTLRAPNPYHAEIEGEFKTKTLKALMKAATIAIPIDNEQARRARERLDSLGVAS